MKKILVSCLLYLFPFKLFRNSQVLPDFLISYFERTSNERKSVSECIEEVACFKCNLCGFLSLTSAGKSAFDRISDQLYNWKYFIS